MNRQTKLILMFAPLVLMFAVIMVVSLDARNPETRQERCHVQKVGPDAFLRRAASATLYRNSDNPQTEIALLCEQMGPVVVNDQDLMRVEITEDNPAIVTQKSYRYLPVRWKVEIKNKPPQKPTEQANNAR